MTDDEQLPSPFTPPGCDLRSFGYMPIEITRLFGSDFHMQATDAEWRAGVTLWLKSYHQCPAASLPADDAALARLAEFGKDIESWRAVRGVALRGWVRCSDGRLYHRTVAEKALEGWLERLRSRKSSGAGNAKRWQMEYDSTEIDEALAEAVRLLQALNPQSRMLQRHRPAPEPKDTVDHPEGDSTVTPDHIPSGSQEKRSEGKGIDLDLGASASAPPSAPTPKKKSSREEHPCFAEFWAEYPPRSGTNPRKPASDKFARLVEAGTDPTDIIAGTKVYAAEIKRTGKAGTEFVKQAVAFLNQEIWADYLRDRSPASRPPADEGEALKRLTVARQRRQWPDEWGPPPGKPGCNIPGHLLQPSDGQGWSTWAVAAA